MRNAGFGCLFLVACSADVGHPTAPADPARSTNEPPSAAVQTPAVGDRETVDIEEIVQVVGAAADGVTDDTAAVRAALASGIAKGRRVVFSAARYRLASTVRVSVPASARLAIGGAGATILGAIEIAGPGAVAIEKLAFDLESTARADRDALRVTGASRVDLTAVSARRAPRWGIAVVEAAGGTIASCTAEDNRYGGLGLEASAKITVTGGTFSKNGTVAPVDGYGVSCMSSAIGPCVDVVIDGVTAEQNERKGIDIHSGHGIAIRNNTVRGFESSGIYAVNEDPGKDVADVVIEDNVVDGAGAQHYVYGIEVGAFSALATRSGTFTIRRNAIRDTSFTTSSAIMVRNPSAGGLAPEKVVIEQNVIERGAASDAYVIRADNYAVPVSEIIVRDNTVGAASAAVGIGLLRVSSATVTGNTVTIAGGYTTYGILIASPSATSVSANTIGGGAQYGTTLSVP